MGIAIDRLIGWRRWVLFALSAPFCVGVGWLYVLLALALGLAEKPTFEAYGILSAQWRAWVGARWRYSTTIGRGIIYRVEARRLYTVQAHERVHVRQFEDATVVGLVFGLVVGIVTANWLLGAALWAGSGALLGLAYFTAALRYGFNRESAYRQSEIERAAYAQSDGA